MFTHMFTIFIFFLLTQVSISNRERCLNVALVNLMHRYLQKYKLSFRSPGGNWYRNAERCGELEVAWHLDWKAMECRDVKMGH